MSELEASAVGAAELPAMRAAIASAGLPAGDLAEPGLIRFASAREGEILGYGGFEIYGADALLRSIVVEPNRRRDGVGRRIVEQLSSYAVRRGVTQVFLLTTDGRAYFETLGFSVVDRRHAPASIAGARQMVGLCPASATLMTRTAAP